jgi:small subunit ribosomal protein S33
MNVPRARLLDLLKVSGQTEHHTHIHHYATPPDRTSAHTPPYAGASLHLTDWDPPLQAQCEIFSTVYNPDGLRLGNKVLRQRLRGPAFAAYYPRRRVTVKDMNNLFGPEVQTWDDYEQERVEYIDEYGLFLSVSCISLSL